MEKHLITSWSQSLRQRKQNLNELHKEVKSKAEVWFFWTVGIHVPGLIAKGPYYYR